MRDSLAEEKYQDAKRLQERMEKVNAIDIKETLYERWFDPPHFLRFLIYGYVLAWFIAFILIPLPIYPRIHVAILTATVWSLASIIVDSIWGSTQ